MVVELPLILEQNKAVVAAGLMAVDANIKLITATAKAQGNQVFIIEVGVIDRICLVLMEVGGFYVWMATIGRALASANFASL